MGPRIILVGIYDLNEDVPWARAAHGVKFFQYIRPNLTKIFELQILTADKVGQEESTEIFWALSG